MHIVAAVGLATLSRDVRFSPLPPEVWAYGTLKNDCMRGMCVCTHQRDQSEVSVKSV